jgi:hypothetical protein
VANNGALNGVWDNDHSNAIIEDPRDDSLIVSMRNQNAIIKFSRQSGQLVWILGPPENWAPEWQQYLLTPVGTPFAWQYGQHAPVFTPQGTLMVYDDGNYRASPFDPFLDNSQSWSRAVEYSIDEQNMAVSQVWQYGSTNEGEWFFTDFEGNAEPEPKTGNVLIDFAYTTYMNGIEYPGGAIAWLREVTHDPVPQVVFDLELSMAQLNDYCSIYRVHRIPDLYPHPAQAVTDLMLTYQDEFPLLEFSGDDTRTYVIETSPDLATWSSIGTANESSYALGEFEFKDTGAAGLAPRYYRVVTQ